MVSSLNIWQAPARKVEHLARLHSLLRQLPLASGSRVLSVGCGIFPSSLTIRTTLPGWTLYGLDLDGEALRRAHQRDPGLHLIQADASHLPGLLHTRFDLILARHPDIFRHERAWKRILCALPDMLVPGGSLLITLYAPEEANLVRTLPLPQPYPLDPEKLSSVDLAGRDRFPLAYVRIDSSNVD
jgi:SAM-dependent methyltransferase